MYSEEDQGLQTFQPHAAGSAVAVEEAETEPGLEAEAYLLCFRSVAEGCVAFAGEAAVGSSDQVEDLRACAGWAQIDRAACQEESQGQVVVHSPYRSLVAAGHADLEEGSHNEVQRQEHQGSRVDRRDLGI